VTACVQTYVSRSLWTLRHIALDRGSSWCSFKGMVDVCQT
jgi:hypothetical protein